MTRITVKFTVKELELLNGLAVDQLFRREFIDSRLPGSNFSAADLSLGKQLVTRLRSITDRAKQMPQGRNGGTVLRRSRATVSRES